MYKVYIDGGSRGNPGQAAIGFIVFNEKNEEIFRFGKKIGKKTNNVAEYTALIEALKYLSKRVSNPNEKIEIYSDSELLTKQLKGIYRVKDDKLKKLYNRVTKILSGFNNVKIVHIKRDKNKISDWIVNRVLDNVNYRPADWPRELQASEESPGS